MKSERLLLNAVTFVKAVKVLVKKTARLLVMDVRVLLDSMRLRWLVQAVKVLLVTVIVFVPYVKF